ncbi:hypothetical protein AYI68_g7348, partial [Smittium mucronatum]
MTTAKVLSPLDSDSVGDYEQYNEHLKYFEGSTWLTAPFLLWETYLY